MSNYHDILFRIAELLSYLPTLDELRESCLTLGQIRSLEAQTIWYGFWKKNSFSWIFDAISCEKNCPTSMLFLLPFFLTYMECRTVEFFPPAESWLVNSNFRRVSRMQGKADSTRVPQPIRLQQYITMEVEFIYLSVIINILYALDQVQYEML